MYMVLVFKKLNISLTFIVSVAEKMMGWETQPNGHTQNTAIHSVAESLAYHKAGLAGLEHTGCLETSLLETSYLETPLFKSISMYLLWSPKIDQGHPKGKEAHPSQPRKPCLPPEHRPQKVCACKIFQAGTALLRSSDLLLYVSMVEVGGEGRTVPPSLDASLCYPGP